MPNDEIVELLDQGHQRPTEAQGLTDAHQMIDLSRQDDSKANKTNEGHQRQDRTAGHQNKTSTKTGKQSPPPQGNAQKPPSEKKN